MESDNRCLLWLIGLLGGFIMGSILGSIYLLTRHDERMAAMGYVERALTGTTRMIWVKAEGQLTP